MEELLRQLRRLERRVAEIERVERGGFWVDWTPTLTQSGSVAHTVAYARYTTVGRLVMVQARLAITASGTAGNTITVGGIPAAIAPANSGNIADVAGSFSYLDNGNTWYAGSVYPASASTLAFIADGRSSAFGVTPNFAVANNDRLGFVAVWER